MAGRPRPLATLCLLLSIVSGSHALASPLVCRPGEQPTGFSGFVRQGDEFEQPFGNGLLFRLATPMDPAIPGWIIEVRPAAGLEYERELSWVATPPYRGWNHRYLDLSYRQTFAEAIGLTPREFAFVAVSDWQRATALVTRLLWPGNDTDAQREAAFAELIAMPVSRGELHIRDARAGRGLAGRDRIEQLTFDVNLCVR